MSGTTVDIRVCTVNLHRAECGDRGFLVTVCCWMTPCELHRCNATLDGCRCPRPSVRDATPPAPAATEEDGFNAFKAQYPLGAFDYFTWQLARAAWDAARAAAPVAGDERGEHRPIRNSAGSLICGRCWRTWPCDAAPVAGGGDAEHAPRTIHNWKDDRQFCKACGQRWPCQWATRPTPRAAEGEGAS